MHIRWAHLVSPQGESFQGFWIMSANRQPVITHPFETKKAAIEALAKLPKLR